MYCRRCGEIVVNGEATCKKCGGRAVESTTGSGAMNTTSNERKDPWTSKYLQRRLNPANVNKGAVAAAPRPISTAYTQASSSFDSSGDFEYPRAPPQRPVTGSPGGGGGGGGGRTAGALDAADVLGLPRPRGIRDAASSRPASMYASGSSSAVLEPPVMSAVQRTVGAQQQQQTSPVVAARGLKSKWSQYFTSTVAEAAAASPESGVSAAGPRKRSETEVSSAGSRMRSESLSAPAIAAAPSSAHRVLRPAHSSSHSMSTTTTATTATATATSQSHPAALAPIVTAIQKHSVATPDMAMRQPARVAAGSAAAMRGMVGSPLIGSPSLVERSRSATLPDHALHAGGAGSSSRPCTTCGRALRAEEQRQFATQPGLVYCTGCYHSSYSRGACAGCGKVVLTHGRPWAQYGDRVWHKLCIRCRSCSRLLVAPLVGDDGEPSCEPCFAARGPLEPPPVPSAIGGSTVCPRPPSPKDLTLSAKDLASALSVAQAQAQALTSAAAAAAAASKPKVFDPPPKAFNPPPRSLDSDAETMDSRLAALRIMSPVEVAAHQGLPPPRAIVDPDSPAAPAEPVPAPRPSPSLRPSTASRTASPRSVSFRIDEEAAAAAAALDEGEEEAPRSLADYVLSKASTAAVPSPRAKAGGAAVVASVADTIKKLAAAAAAANQKGAPAQKSAAVPAAQNVELHDLIRTHQREAPTDPTVPALDKHSRILKSRPRNANNRRGPQASESSQQPNDTPPPNDTQPNTCARCARGIEDTWFRLSDGRQVHVECFSCQGCGALIDDGVYVLDAGVEFHPQCVPPAPPPVVVSVSPAPSDHSSSQGRVRGPRAPRRDECCDRCAAVLTGPRFQLTNGKQYHPQCFACAGCGQRFDEGSYVCFEGHEYHHHCVDTRHNNNSNSNSNSSNSQPPRQQQQQQQQENDDEDALVCAQCRKHIEGVFLRHNDAVFHPPCFCCNDCRRPITPGMPFGEIDARPCCESCLERRASSAHIPMPQHYQHQRHQQQQQQQQYY